MAAALNALDWLSKSPPKAYPGVCVAYGDDAFLKRLVLSRLRKGILGDGDGEYSWDELDEKETKVALRDVLDELSTVSLFGSGKRVVAVLNADEFVTRFRPQLEDYVAKPRDTGVLILDVKTWPANTRLFKAVAASGLQIECKGPSADRASGWLVQWAGERHQAKLERPAAELMVDIVGPELGLLDQELAKLASAAGEQPIDVALVRDLVGGWRAKTAWELIDAALGGQSSEALQQLDRLLSGGEHPLAVLGPLGWSLRQMGAAVGVLEQGDAAGRKPSLRTAMEQAGVKPFVIGKVEKQLMRLGRQRGSQLLRWLLEADLAMKGSSSSNHRARLVLEELICRLSAPSAQSSKT
ncbi:MAG: DNA polymerase III subunit delta [Planctomycetia bacterium]|nr:DNA polymerase III subunit delta [Planctomycetia bacterium]